MNRISLPMLLIFLLLVACNSTSKKKLTDYGGVQEVEDNTAVNVIEQAKPVIMVIPSDNLLQCYGALTSTTIGGKTILVRDYSKYLLCNTTNKSAIVSLQDQFVKLGYPLTDLSQSLKALSNRNAHNAADNVEQDAKTQLLQTISPDIIIELDYTYMLNSNGHTYNRNLAYTVTALDAYTNKVFATINAQNMTGDDFDNLYSSSLNKKMKSFTGEINEYFRDIVANGREITVRFTIQKGSKINLASEIITGDLLSDWIMDYMDLYTKKGTYKLQNNTDFELSFTNVRISTLRPDGTQNSGYNWARECIKEMREECGIKCSNKVQGLGDVHIMIKGL